MQLAPSMGRDVGYAASKASLNMVTIKLASRLRDDGIAVIAIHPGHLKTDMGGTSAAMETSDGATSIAALIDGLTPDQSGSFLRWDGSTHPW
jgi:NAD(P)-dependent dehydrogenase (short-subunit alcohol dehydrogenase family)